MRGMNGVGESLRESAVFNFAGAVTMVIDDSPFALELTYRRSISRETLVDTSLDEIRRINGEPLDSEQQSVWTKQMSQAFVDVKDGTRITGVFLPGEGCRFYVDGELQHVIDDPEFARAFFSIWLDPQTRSPKLRAALLGLNP